MQITLQALELALAPLEEVGKGEISFDVNGTTVTLRRLLPEEESEVQKFAVNKDGDEDHGTLEYIERFKLAIVSYALVAIGPTDLRDTTHIETGEVLANGKAVKLPRHQALRKLLLKWTSPLRIAMFRKYVDLLNRVEAEAEKAIVFDPTDLNTEIERLEERLAKLKVRRDEEKETLQSDVSKMVRAIDDTEHQVVPSEADEAPEVEEAAEAPEPEEPTQPPVVVQTPVQAPVAAPQQPVQPPVQRRSAIPQSVAQPVQPQQPAQTQQPQRQQVQQPNAGHYVAGMDVDDSFVDMSDGATMADAIEAENRRMWAARQQAPQQELPSVLSQVHQSRRIPPHLAARQTQSEIEEVDAPDDEMSDETRFIRRTVDGVEAFQMTPPEEMSTRRAPMPQRQRPAPATGLNPHFQPPKKI